MRVTGFWLEISITLSADRLFWTVLVQEAIGNLVDISSLEFIGLGIVSVAYSNEHSPSSLLIFGTSAFRQWPPGAQQRKCILKS